MKSASASCPVISEPASSIALAEISAHDSHDGGSIQPSRMPGVSRLLAEPMYRTRSGASPWSDADPLAAQLRVVVVLDDQPVAALRPLDQLGAAARAQHRAGRELMGRRHHDRLGAAVAERRDVDPLGIDRNRGHR